MGYDTKVVFDRLIFKFTCGIAGVAQVIVAEAGLIMPARIKSSLYLLIPLCLVCVVLLAFLGNAKGASVVAVVMLSVMVLIDIDKLKSFTLWGMKADLHDQTAEARLATEKAYSAYKMCIAATVHLLTNSGRFSSVAARRNGHEMVCDIEERARGLEEDGGIVEALANYKKTIRWDYVNDIKRLARRRDNGSRLHNEVEINFDNELPTAGSLTALAEETPDPGIYEELIRLYHVALDAEMPDMSPGTM